MYGWVGIAGPHQLYSCQYFNLLKQINSKQTMIMIGLVGLVVYQRRSYFVYIQDLESHVMAGEEELALSKRQAEETEGNLRQTVEQLNEESIFRSSFCKTNYNS